MSKEREKREKVTGRNLALTIIVGIFIAIILVVLINLIVDYSYPSPTYEKYCNFSTYPYGGQYNTPYVDKINPSNCSFNQTLNDEANQCTNQGGAVVYNYTNQGCPNSIIKCDMCQKQYDDAQKGYNRNVFFVFAALGFVLIVVGLFVSRLLLQIIALPSGAILVIESAIRNFNDKLAVIIVLALLVIAAIYLALKKLR